MFGDSLFVPFTLVQNRSDGPDSFIAARCCCRKSDKLLSCVGENASQRNYTSACLPPSAFVLKGEIASINSLAFSVSSCSLEWLTVFLISPLSIYGPLLNLLAVSAPLLTRSSFSARKNTTRTHYPAWNREILSHLVPMKCKLEINFSVFCHNKAHWLPFPSDTE